MSKKQGFTKDQKDELAGFFSDAFHDVVVPVLSDIKNELSEVRNQLSDTREELGTKIDNVNKHMIKITDHHGDRIDEQEKRLKKLETN